MNKETLWLWTKKFLKALGALLIILFTILAAWTVYVNLPPLTIPFLAQPTPTPTPTPENITQPPTLLEITGIYVIEQPQNISGKTIKPRQGLFINLQFPKKHIPFKIYKIKAIYNQSVWGLQEYLEKPKSIGETETTLQIIFPLNKPLPQIMESMKIEVVYQPKGEGFKRYSWSGVPF